MKTRALLTFVSLLAVSSSLLAAPPSDYVPMKVIQTDAVVYPRKANELGITSGQVNVSIQVDEAGKLTDVLVTRHTHPVLAETAVLALKRWRYEPAWIHGQTRSARIDLVFSFESRGMVVVDMTADSYLAMQDLKLRPNAYTYSARTLHELDRIPTPTKVVHPVNPAQWPHPGPVNVTVDFFIDESGRVRLPAVGRETSETADQFAAAAVNAVTQWQFEPPLSKGQPVLVAARQLFTFKP